MGVLDRCDTRVEQKPLLLARIMHNERKEEEAMMKSKRRLPAWIDRNVYYPFLLKYESSSDDKAVEGASKQSLSGTI